MPAPQPQPRPAPSKPGAGPSPPAPAEGSKPAPAEESKPTAEPTKPAEGTKPAAPSPLAERLAKVLSETMGEQLPQLLASESRNMLGATLATCGDLVAAVVEKDWNQLAECLDTLFNLTRTDLNSEDKTALVDAVSSAFAPGPK